MDAPELQLLGGLPKKLSTPWQDTRCLVFLFCLWKAVLFVVIALAPGPGYDTSSTLLNDANSWNISSATFGETATSAPFPLKNVRWDAIYFLQIARRKYVFEQEWAFGPGFPSLVSFVKQALLRGSVHDQASSIGALGVFLSTICHLLSVLSLYSLSTTILSQAPPSRSSLPVAVAALHIFNPAGAFLLSPCPESLFSSLHFLGFQLFAYGLRHDDPRRTLRGEAGFLAAGVVFGLATTVRSNGLLSGGLFLFEAAVSAASLLSGNHFTENLKRLIIVCIGGCCIALGAIIPQYVAFKRYCTFDAGDGERPWCNNTVPSIYAWVQSHYWNVGLFRYWTFSNLPLFLLAAPTISILCMSAWWAWDGDLGTLNDRPPQSSSSMQTESRLRSFLRRSAVPQALLAIMALLSYHVQIITRLSSGYPLWYLWLISSIRTPERKGVLDFHTTLPEAIVRWMVIYAMVQGALFASFLPPA